MTNIYMAYEVITPAIKTDTEGVAEKVVPGQAYIKASDHVEAEKKLRQFLGKKVEVRITQFADANAEIIA